MNEELEAHRVALAADIAKSCATFDAAMRQSADNAVPLRARVAAIEQEAVRMARAGVRINVNAGNFDQRRIEVMGDTLKHYQAIKNAMDTSAAVQTRLLSRAVVLLQEMADAVNAAEQVIADRDAAAAAEETEAAKVHARWRASSHYGRR